jgi:hypothetical protein
VLKIPRNQKTEKPADQRKPTVTGASALPETRTDKIDVRRRAESKYFCGGSKLKSGVPQHRSITTIIHGNFSPDWLGGGV